MIEREGPPWSPPPGREAWDEQAKLRGNLLNAAAIAFFIAAVAGPLLNANFPSEGPVRFGLFVFSWIFHLLARFVV
jgi:hypothetical protein